MPNFEERIDGVKDKQLITPQDYNLFKGEFVTGPYPTVVAFASAKGLDKRTMARCSKGWSAERKMYIENTTKIIMESDMERKMLGAINVQYVLSSMISTLDSQHNNLRNELVRLNSLREDIESRGDAKVTDVEDRSTTNLKGRENKIMDQMRSIEKNIGLLSDKYEKYLRKGPSTSDREKEAAESLELRSSLSSMHEKITGKPFEVIKRSDDFEEKEVNTA